MKPSFVRRSHKLYMQYVELKVRYHERMGNGTNDKIRSYAENGLSEPAFSYRDGFVTTIWRPKSKNADGNGEMPGKMPGKKLSKTEAKVVQLMRDNPTARPQNLWVKIA